MRKSASSGGGKRRDRDELDGFQLEGFDKN